MAIPQAQTRLDHNKTLTYTFGLSCAAMYFYWKSFALRQKSGIKKSNCCVEKEFFKKQQDWRSQT